MSCFVQYAPYNLKEGTWDEKRDEFGDTVVNTIAEHAPNIKELIIDRQVLTPLDLERDFGLSEGNIFQGELTLEQLFFLRPAPGWAQYRTPIKSLYMKRVSAPASIRPARPLVPSSNHICGNGAKHPTTIARGK